MTRYGFKVSKQGFDARTASGKDLVADSDDNSPKIILEGSGQVVNSSPYFTVPIGKTVIPHNLGYVPSYDLFFKPSGTNKWHPHRGRYNFDGVAFSDLVDWWAEIDANNLTIYSQGDTVRTHDFYYMILVDPGKLGSFDGPNSGSGYGIRIAQGGFDADDVDKNQVFIDTANTYKPSVYKTISVSVPAAPGDETEVSAGHGLGYAPAFSAMVSGDVNTDRRGVPYSFTDLGLDLRVYSDGINVTAYVRNTGAVDATMTFKIVIFENELG